MNQVSLKPLDSSLTNVYLTLPLKTSTKRSKGPLSSMCRGGQWKECTGTCWRSFQFMECHGNLFRWDNLTGCRRWRGLKGLAAALGTVKQGVVYTIGRLLRNVFQDSAGVSIWIWIHKIGAKSKRSQILGSWFCQSCTDLEIEYVIIFFPLSLSLFNIFYDSVGQHSLASCNDGGSACGNAGER